MNAKHDIAWGFAEVDDEKDRRIEALNAELASYRAPPLVPARSHELACAQRDALRSALAAVMRVLGRTAGGPDEAAVFAHARGVLAEAGVVSEDIEGYRRAFEEWEGRR